MKVEDFMRLKQEFDEHESVLLGVKKTEYASDEDHLSNFKEVASWLGIYPEEYCMTLTLKHMHSILRAVKSQDYRWSWSSDIGEGLKQRISDARNYLLLLAALIEERECDDTMTKEDNGYCD